MHIIFYSVAKDNMKLNSNLEILKKTDKTSYSDDYLELKKELRSAFF